MLSVFLVATLIILGHTIGLFTEYRRHLRHTAVLAQYGGRPQSVHLMKALYTLWALAAPLAVIAGIFNHSGPEPQWTALGIAVIGVSQLFRRWAIHSLGAYWTMGLVALPGRRSLNAGPYRILKNPEYISRFTELCGVGLATGGWVPVALALVATSALLVKALRAESAFLDSANLAPISSIE